VFGRGIDNHLHHTYQTEINGQTWSAWEEISEKRIINDPEVISNLDGLFEVFALDELNKICHVSQKFITVRKVYRLE